MRVGLLILAGVDILLGSLADSKYENVDVTIEEKIYSGNIHLLAKRLDILEVQVEKLLQENKYLRTKTFHTCEELRSLYNETGVYALDPEGLGQAVQLHCDMETGFTVVDHDQGGTQNVTWCQDVGCYSL